MEALEARTLGAWHERSIPPVPLRCSAAGPFAAIARVFMIAFPTLSHDWSVILAILAAVTMIVGNTAAVSQQSIKRMLAYSSIAHAGYILVAVVAASRVGMASLLFYTVGYTVMNLGAFMVVILLGKRSEDHLLISDYAGLSRRHPVLAGLMALFMLSLAGIPPTVGFVGKFYIFTAAVQADYAWLAVIGLLSSVISVYYYLRVVYQMYMVRRACSRWPARLPHSSAKGCQRCVQCNARYFVTW
ncbi:MAG: NADH-quinone oxidoreductase subunit N [Chloroflexi bacterium]|nr:NADH-quinone oxidoreductase subunit N [Chloroflexota bacterium]